MSALGPVLVAGGVLVIGRGLSLAAFPAGTISLAARAAAIFGLGYAGVVLSGVVLILFGAFSPLAMAILLTALTAAGWMIGLRRSPAGAHVAEIRAKLKDRSAFFWLGSVALIVVAIAWAARPVLPLAGGWRYWADGLEVADAGGIPDFSAQWGLTLAPAISKIAGNAFLGALSFGFRDNPYTGMAIALWLSAVGLAVSAWAMARELGLVRLAALFPLVLVAGASLPGDVVLNQDIASKLDFYQHEDMGRALAFAGAALMVGRTTMAKSVVAGVLLGAAALTHLIPVVALSLLIGGVLIARLITTSDRRDLLRASAAAIGTAVAIMVLPLALARGEVAFTGASDPESYRMVDGNDPTALFKGLTREPRPKTETRWYEPPSTTATAAAEGAAGREVTGAGAAIVGVVLIAGAGLVAWRGTRRLRLLGVGALSMAVGLVVLGLLFSFRYSLFAQGTFGERRLFEYASIPLVLVGLAALEVVLRMLVKKRPVAGGVATGIVLAVLAATCIAGLGPDDRVRRPSAHLAAAVTVPCDSRLLTERPTRGAFQSLTGRISVNEGLAPFLRPDVIDDVLEMGEATASFLTDPEGESALLSEKEIDFVIARRTPALDDASTLRFQREVDGVGVYQVVDSPTTRRLPTPSESPGYHCFREVPS